jgi:non-heme chloroperoxidase
MTTLITDDGTEIYYKDWGDGPTVLFVHGWPLSADAWDPQLLFFVDHGYRVVAHDRRGHGRSTQSATGNTMDGYADDLAAVIDSLDLRDVTLVGHSTGGGDVARYIGRHGTDRVAKSVLVSSITPTLVQTKANPSGVPMKAFDDIRSGVANDHSQFYKKLAAPFYGANMSGTNVSQGVLDQFWLWSMQSGLKNAVESITASSQADFTQDLKKFDVPTLIIHGDEDQFAPVENSATKSAQLIPGALKMVYPGAPHGLTTTHQDRFNSDLLLFLRD